MRVQLPAGAASSLISAIPAMLGPRDRMGL
jgi:hypothetical protein